MVLPTDDHRLQQFLERYPSRPYQPRNSPYPDTQLEQVGPADGLWYLNEVPHNAPEGSPRTVHDDDGENCHLWVVDQRGGLASPRRRWIVSVMASSTTRTSRAADQRRSVGRSGSVNLPGYICQAHPAGTHLSTGSTLRMPNASSGRLVSMWSH